MTDALAWLDNAGTLPATPWDFADMLDLEELPERPREVVLSEESSDGANAPEVTAEDYDGVERVVFEKIKKRVRLACNVNTLWRERILAAEWVFASQTEDKEGVTFRLACRALGARHIVLQTRLQYQLYKAGIPYQEPLPLLSDALPETVASEVLLHAGTDGLDVARQVWRWPGIRADVLRDKLSDIPLDIFQRVTRRLEDTGHMGLKHACWFMITRNPEMFAAEGRRRFLWSKSFLGDN